MASHTDFAERKRTTTLKLPSGLRVPGLSLGLASRHTAQGGICRSERLSESQTLLGVVIKACWAPRLHRNCTESLPTCHISSLTSPRARGLLTTGPPKNPATGQPTLMTSADACQVREDEHIARVPGGGGRGSAHSTLLWGPKRKGGRRARPRPQAATLLGCVTGDYRHFPPIDTLFPRVS